MMFCFMWDLFCIFWESYFASTHRQFTIYQFTTNNKNTLTRYEVHSKLTVFLFSVSVLVTGYNLTQEWDAIIKTFYENVFLFSSNMCFSITLQSIGIQHLVYTSFSQFGDSNISTFFCVYICELILYRKIEIKVNCNLLRSIFNLKI